MLAVAGSIGNGDFPGGIGCLSRSNRALILGHGSGSADEPRSSGPEHGFRSAVKLELSIDLGEVVANRLMADAPARRDGVDGLGVPDHREDLTLCGRKLRTGEF